MFASLLLTASLAAAPEAPPAPRIPVGDPSVAGSALRPYTNLWEFTQQRPGGDPVVAGTWSDALEATTYGGRPAWRRTQVAKYTKKEIEIRFVDVFDRETMAPYTFDYSRSSDGNVRHVDFEDGRVRFRETEKRGAAPVEKTAALDRRVFNFYGLYGVLVSTLPLATGFRAEIPAFDTTRMAIDWVPVRVTGREAVPAGAGKTVNAWVVETPTRLYGRMRWWVTKTAPYVIRAVLEIPKDENGSGEVAAIVTYRMI